ncbi:hypothetical protein [Dyadobacter sp. CY347]|uniref:hypothetical protein n=1 Tax=Dyadobacter sp. CY347 TaxID=2909336 RepID=UPI001F2A83F4|nr:hypothetical protein [Dyadobacter sp. CY347]MCF2488913.1 hypothetical protein [Dyadobacter sp. CY347]
MQNLSPYINGIFGRRLSDLCVFFTQLFQLKDQSYFFPLRTLFYAEHNQQNLEGVEAKATLALLTFSVVAEPAYCNREYKKI